MEQFILTKAGVNFRSCPTTSSDVIKFLKKGTVVEVLDTVDDTTWYKARLEDGTKGYITSLTKYVEPFVPEWLQTAQEVIAYGDSYLGTEYLFGSSRSNDITFDCSDFVQWCLKKFGIKVDSNSRTQSDDGIPADLDDLRTGDLVFFDTNSDNVINHVGFYVHENRLLHTYRKGIGVTYSDFKPGGYWRNRAVSARRVILS